MSQAQAPQNTPIGTEINTYVYPLTANPGSTGSGTFTATAVRTQPGIIRVVVDRAVARMAMVARTVLVGGALATCTDYPAMQPIGIHGFLYTRIGEVKTGLQTVVFLYNSWDRSDSSF